jgi:hypothetical protein
VSDAGGEDGTHSSADETSVENGNQHDNVDDQEGSNSIQRDAPISEILALPAPEALEQAHCRVLSVQTKYNEFLLTLADTQDDFHRVTTEDYRVLDTIYVDEMEKILSEESISADGFIKLSAAHTAFHGGAFAMPEVLVTKAETGLNVAIRAFQHKAADTDVQDMCADLPPRVNAKPTDVITSPLSTADLEPRSMDQRGLDPTVPPVSLTHATRTRQARTSDAATNAPVFDVSLLVTHTHLNLQSAANLRRWDAKHLEALIEALGLTSYATKEQLMASPACVAVVLQSLPLDAYPPPVITKDGDLITYLPVAVLVGQLTLLGFPALRSPASDADFKDTDTYAILHPPPQVPPVFYNATRTMSMMADPGEKSTKAAERMAMMVAILNRPGPRATCSPTPIYTMAVIATLLGTQGADVDAPIAIPRLETVLSLIGLRWAETVKNMADTLLHKKGASPAIMTTQAQASALTSTFRNMTLAPAEWGCKWKTGAKNTGPVVVQINPTHPNDRAAAVAIVTHQMIRIDACMAAALPSARRLELEEPSTAPLKWQELVVADTLFKVLEGTIDIRGDPVAALRTALTLGANLMYSNKPTVRDHDQMISAIAVLVAAHPDISLQRRTEMVIRLLPEAELAHDVVPAFYRDFQSLSAVVTGVFGCKEVAADLLSIDGVWNQKVIKRARKELRKSAPSAVASTRRHDRPTNPPTETETKPKPKSRRRSTPPAPSKAGSANERVWLEDGEEYDDNGSFVSSLDAARLPRRESVATQSRQNATDALNGYRPTYSDRDLSNIYRNRGKDKVQLGTTGYVVRADHDAREVVQPNTFPAWAAAEKTLTAERREARRRVVVGSSKEDKRDQSVDLINMALNQSYHDGRTRTVSDQVAYHNLANTWADYEGTLIPTTDTGVAMERLVTTIQASEMAVGDRVYHIAIKPPTDQLFARTMGATLAPLDAAEYCSVRTYVIQPYEDSRGSYPRLVKAVLESVEVNRYLDKLRKVRFATGAELEGAPDTLYFDANKNVFGERPDYPRPVDISRHRTMVNVDRSSRDDQRNNPTPRPRGAPFSRQINIDMGGAGLPEGQHQHLPTARRQAENLPRHDAPLAAAHEKPAPIARPRTQRQFAEPTQEWEGREGAPAMAGRHGATHSGKDSCTIAHPPSNEPRAGTIMDLELFRNIESAAGVSLRPPGQQIPRAGSMDFNTRGQGKSGVRTSDGLDDPDPERQRLRRSLQQSQDESERLRKQLADTARSVRNPEPPALSNNTVCRHDYSEWDVDEDGYCGRVPGELARQTAYPPKGIYQSNGALVPELSDNIQSKTQSQYSLDQTFQVLGNVEDKRVTRMGLLKANNGKYVQRITERYATSYGHAALASVSSTPLWQALLLDGPGGTSLFSQFRNLEFPSDTMTLSVSTLSFRHFLDAPIGDPNSKYYESISQKQISTVVSNISRLMGVVHDDRLVAPFAVFLLKVNNQHDNQFGTYDHRFLMHLIMMAIAKLKVATDVHIACVGSSHHTTVDMLGVLIPMVLVQINPTFENQNVFKQNLRIYSKARQSFNKNTAENGTSQTAAGQRGKRRSSDSDDSDDSASSARKRRKKAKTTGPGPQGRTPSPAIKQQQTQKPRSASANPTRAKGQSGAMKPSQSPYQHPHSNNITLCLRRVAFLLEVSTVDCKDKQCTRVHPTKAKPARADEVTHAVNVLKKGDATEVALYGAALRAQLTAGNPLFAK